MSEETPADILDYVYATGFNDAMEQAEYSLKIAAILGEWGRRCEEEDARSCGGALKSGNECPECSALVPPEACHYDWAMGAWDCEMYRRSTR